MSTSSYASAILFISDQLVTYSGFILLVTGLIGNILNILIFRGLKLFRGNQSVFYIMVGSIVDCGTLLIECFYRIQSRAYHYDLTGISQFWCKLRPMLLQIFIMISLTTVCFSSIDQYLSTNPRYTWRQMSTLKLAQRLTLINICIWILHSIPSGIFYKIQAEVGCTILHPGFRLYISFGYLFLLNGVVPLLTSSIFSILSYRNVRRIVRLQLPIVRRRLERQLTAMVLARVLFLFVVSIPFGVSLIYSLNVSFDRTDSAAIAVYQLVRDVTSTLFYFNYAVCQLFNFISPMII